MACGQPWSRLRRANLLKAVDRIRPWKITEPKFPFSLGGARVINRFPVADRGHLPRSQSRNGVCLHLESRQLFLNLPAIGFCCEALYASLNPITCLGGSIKKVLDNRYYSSLSR